MKWAAGCFGMIFLVAFLLVLDPTAPLDTPEETMNFTFIAPYANSGYWGMAAGGIEEACEENKISLKCIGFDEMDPEKQIRYIKSAVYSDADGIITAGIENSSEFQEVLKLASEAGIPVVLIDCDAQDSQRLCYVGTDNRNAGQTAGEILAEATQGNGKIAVIKTTPTSINQEERLDGFYEAIAGYPDLKIGVTIAGSSQYMLLKQKIVDTLEQHPEIDAIFCTEGYTSNAICQILLEEPEEYSDLKVVIFDNTNTYQQSGLEQGLIYAALRQDPYSMGEKAVEYLIDYLTVGTVPPDVFNTELDIFNQENYAQAEIARNEDISWYIY